MDSFKGTSSTQDIRFGDKEKKLLRSTKFPAELNTKVDMRKVELSVMKPWIAKKILALLGFEDEVVIEYVSGLLEDETNPVVDGKKMMISLLGFLDKQTEPFMVELWTLLLSAQESPVKVPAIFIEQKKEEMRKRQEEKARNDEIALIRSRNEDNKARATNDIRQRERQERSGQRDNGWARRDNNRGDNDNARGGGGMRDSYQPGGGSDKRRRDDERPPPPRRRDGNDDRRNRDRRDDRRRRSPSRSRSPPRRRRRSTPPAESKKPSRGRDTTPKGARSDSRSRSRSRSRSPPRRERRRSPSRSRSRSRSPPRKRKSDVRDDRNGDSRRRISPSRSVSRSPPRVRKDDVEMRAPSHSPENVSKEDELKARLKARKAT